MRVTFAMLDMEMGEQSYQLAEGPAGVYTVGATPALVMVGNWGLTFTVAPQGARAFTATIVDRAAG